MPNLTMSTFTGFEPTTDNRWTPSDNGLGKMHVTDFAAVQDIVKIDTLLATIDGVYWTSKRLDQESIWDKLYYLRVNRRGTASLT